MKKLIAGLFLFFSFMLTGSVFAAGIKTNLMRADLITVKTELEKLYYKASSKKTLSSKDIARLNEIKSAVDLYKKDGNTNVVPIYYKLGNTYKMSGKRDEAISCYRTIVKYFPTSPLAKKSLVNLKYYGETVDVNGRTRMIPKEDE